MSSKVYRSTRCERGGREGGVRVIARVRGAREQRRRLVRLRDGIAAGRRAGPGLRVELEVVRAFLAPAVARKVQKHVGRTRSISSSGRPSKMSSSRPRSSCCGTTYRLPVLRMSR